MNQECITPHSLHGAIMALADYVTTMTRATEVNLALKILLYESQRFFHPTSHSKQGKVRSFNTVHCSQSYDEICFFVFQFLFSVL